MTQYNLNNIQANSSNDLVSKIGKERIKHCKCPDIKKMTSVCVPSLRLQYFCKSQKRVEQRIAMIREIYPDREITISKPKKV
jgi:hypothetical protein